MCRLQVSCSPKQMGSSLESRLVAGPEGVLRVSSKQDVLMVQPTTGPENLSNKQDVLTGAG